ncbi:MAG: response regulator [Bryobacteraceae bacterium]
MAEKVTILLAEELTLIRESIVVLCETIPGYRVLAQVEDGQSAIEQIESLAPSVAVLDLNLPRLHSLEVIRRVQREGLATKVVTLSTRRDRKTVLEVLRAGASAFVLKSGPARHLLDAIGQVLEGAIYVSPALEIEKLFITERGRRAESEPLESLSAREYQVFSLLIEGIRAKEIAARLDLSPKTVDTYRASLMRKLDIHDVAGLVKFAIQKNLIST